MSQNLVNEAIQVIIALGFPRAQQNERSALSLLALLNLAPGKSWKQARQQPVGITPIMDWMRDNYQKNYKPNTRETVRRQTMHQFVESGLAQYNPDDPDRPVNSPHAVYQIDHDALALLKTFGTAQWDAKLSRYLKKKGSLVAKYAKARNQHLIPVKVADGKSIKLSAGKHSELIKEIIEKFVPRFVPGGMLVYVGDTGDKMGYFNVGLLKDLGVTVDSHGKMPDAVIYCPDNKWLILIEAVTSHGPVDGKRHAELEKLFADASIGLVYVTAFPERSLMGRYLNEIAWETEVWVADSPSHLIHFNGTRFLGPY